MEKKSRTTSQNNCPMHIDRHRRQKGAREIDNEATGHSDCKEIFTTAHCTAQTQP
uniref:Uncharacterized protein n=1 Tax=Ascaris lumbricoides TaxID=6252 RepID=A0A0M3I2T7_ASCLU